MSLTINMEAKNRVLCIRLKGDLDHHTAEKIEKSGRGSHSKA